LVGLHGGTLEAHSEGEGTGSEFVVRLPLARAEEPGKGSQEGGFFWGETPAQRRVLVADDNIDAGDSLAMLLRGMGHDVRVARDGLEALHLAEEFRPQFILMDIGMPKLDGYEACRRIRIKHWGESPVIVALTGWGQDGDRARSREAGFTHHLTKPVDLAMLRRMLDALGHGTHESP
jgi:CheY-like chemotaxis protein